MSNFDPDHFEPFIIKYLLSDKNFARSYLEKLNPELFSEKYKNIVTSIFAYFKKYNDIPARNVIEKALLPKLLKEDQEKVSQNIETLDNVHLIDENVNYEFLTDETKKFIKTRTIMNAFVKCVDLLEKQEHETIVSTMEKAFRLDFDESLGIEYFEDLEERLERSQIKSKPISTTLPTLDRYIGGGYRKKAVYVFAAASNVGKTLFLNDAAINLVNSGHNVLYISLELTQDYMAERTDAKFAEVSMNIVNATPEVAIKKAIAKRENIKKNGKKFGKLYYKEYSPGSVTCNDIRGLLRNLAIKKDFKCDVIIIDYLKLLKPQGKVYGDNTYNMYNQISIDIKALGKEEDVVILTAVQTGRQSFNNSSVGMSDVSDSIAIAQNADVLVTLARDETLDKEDMVRVNIAKSRFSRNTNSFLLKADYEYMRLVDLDNEREKDDFPKTEKKKVPEVKSPVAQKKPKTVDDDFGLKKPEL